MSSSGRQRRLSAAPAKDQTCRRIERMEAEREERRRAMVERKKARAEQEQKNIAAGNPGDVDFIGMVEKWRSAHQHEARRALFHSVDNDGQNKVCICVRKRPISDKERKKNDHDSVTCLNPNVWIHCAKLRVDGITKYLDHTSFQFDYAFDENTSTFDIYKNTCLPLLHFCLSGKNGGGRATVFAFGQTGSGKTYTMQGIQELLAQDMFLLLEEDDIVGFSFFELYDGCIQDLLNQRQRLKLLEDAMGEINVTGLTESEAKSPTELLDLLEAGNQERTTHTTEANDTSSRSHAICQILLRDRSNGALRGKLSLVDLAGSERGTDTKTHNAQRRGESAEINTSLLALKECIRAKKGHVPYRSSKLTLILKDCFTSEQAKMTMIATVSPGASAADHSLNTLRYADRTMDKHKQTPPRRISPKAAASSSSSSSSTTTMVTAAAAATKKHHAPQRVSPKPTIPATDKHSSPKRISPRPATTTTISPTKSHTNKLAAAAKRHTNAKSQHQQQERAAPTSTTRLEEQEEELLNQHVMNISENAELLDSEGRMLTLVQDNNNVDEYASRLQEILNKKENMILRLDRQMQIVHLAQQQEKEQQQPSGR